MKGLQPPPGPGEGSGISRGSRERPERLFVGSSPPGLYPARPSGQVANPPAYGLRVPAEVAIPRQEKYACRNTRMSN